MSTLKYDPSWFLEDRYIFEWENQDAPFVVCWMEGITTYPGGHPLFILNFYEPHSCSWMYALDRFKTEAEARDFVVEQYTYGAEVERVRKALAYSHKGASVQTGIAVNALKGIETGKHVATENDRLQIYNWLFQALKGNDHGTGRE